MGARSLLHEIDHFRVPPGPLYQNEVKCSAFDIEMTLHSHSNKTHFHKKGCALGLILKVRVFGTQKWPIVQFDGIGKLDALFLVDSTEHFLFLLLISENLWETQTFPASNINTFLNFPQLESHILVWKALSP